MPAARGQSWVRGEGDGGGAVLGDLLTLARSAAYVLYLATERGVSFKVYGWPASQGARIAYGLWGQSWVDTTEMGT